MPDPVSETPFFYDEEEPPMPRGDGHYQRPKMPDSQIPQERVVVRSRGSRGHAVSGVEFHTPPWALMEARSPLELEMVPEPGNPWDRSAVAIDFDGQRIGYLPAEMAPSWQPYVLAKRKEGIVIFVPGTMGNGSHVAVVIPGHRTLMRMSAEVGIVVTNPPPPKTRIYY